MFLNAQMPNIEVLAVEIKQFRGVDLLKRLSRVSSAGFQTHPHAVRQVHVKD